MHGWVHLNHMNIMKMMIILRECLSSQELFLGSFKKLFKTFFGKFAKFFQNFKKIEKLSQKLDFSQIYESFSKSFQIFEIEIVNFLENFLYKKASKLLKTDLKN